MVLPFRGWNEKAAPNALEGLDAAIRCDAWPCVLLTLGYVLQGFLGKALGVNMLALTGRGLARYLDCYVEQAR